MVVVFFLLHYPDDRFLHTIGATAAIADATFLILFKQKERRLAARRRGGRGRVGPSERAQLRVRQIVEGALLEGLRALGPGDVEGGVEGLRDLIRPARLPRAGAAPAGGAARTPSSARPRRR